MSLRTRSLVGGVALALVAAVTAGGCMWPAEPPRAQPDAGDAMVAFPAPDAAPGDASTGADAAPVSDACPPDGGVCDGECVDLASDPRHCGACGAACPGGAPHTAATCVAGTCGLACEPRTADCNELPEDGCEVALHTDNACTSCVDRCSAGYHCAATAAASARACCVPSADCHCGPADYCAMLADGSRACCRDAPL